MTAGVRAIRQPQRCGCCDQLETVAICERCDEPTCLVHFARVESFDGAVQYVCVICAEALAQEAAAPQRVAVVA